MATKFRREFKNVVYNYSDAEAKVREATSNDPWGPSSALMAELADYTFHVQAYSLVMGMLWKRLNDHGRNWRHVYKALTVLEYLIKNGSERVAQQCKDNLFSIQTLKDFQYMDKEGKDQGTTIREKAKQLVALVKDDKRIKEERARATETRDKEAHESEGAATAGLAKASPKTRTDKKVQFTEPQSPTGGGVHVIQDVEQARPGDQSEEALQLKLAIQLSKQQAENEEKLRAQEEESLRAAIAISQQDSVSKEDEDEGAENSAGNDNLLLDLDASITALGDPWATSITEAPPSYDLVAGEALNDPWASIQTGPSVQPSVSTNDPFSPWGGGSVTSSATSSVPTQPPPTADPWSVFSTPAATTSLPPTNAPPVASLNPFDLTGVSASMPPTGISPNASPKPNRRVEDEFLGDLATLVDLDTLSAPPATKPIMGPTPSNPFGTPTTQQRSANPFDANKPPAPTLHQLASAIAPGYSQDLLPAPLIPLGTSGGGPPAPATGQPVQPFPDSNQTINPFS